MSGSSPDALMAAIWSELAAKPDTALVASKRLIKQASLDPLEEAAKSENQEFMDRVTSEEAKEALAAFLEKRPPSFAKSPKHV